MPACDAMPCGVRCGGTNWGCQTVTAEADPCYEHIRWAMTEGIYAQPLWYPNLKPTSPREAFQCELVLSTQVPQCDTPPCNYPCDGEYSEAAGGTDSAPTIPGFRRRILQEAATAGQVNRWRRRSCQLDTILTNVRVKNRALSLMYQAPCSGTAAVEDHGSIFRQNLTH